MKKIKPIESDMGIKQRKPNQKSNQNRIELFNFFKIATLSFSSLKIEINSEFPIFKYNNLLLF